MPKPDMAVAVMVKRPDKPEDGKITFDAPEGFDLEGKEPGDMVEAVVELEVEEGGKLCLRKLNGIDVGGYDEKGVPPGKLHMARYGGKKTMQSFTDAVMSGGEEEA